MLGPIAKSAIGVSGGLILLASLGLWKRHFVVANLLRMNPELLAPVDEGPGVTWFDDYYTVEQLYEGLYAINEPLYWQRNTNYLIVGEERALLLDAGPGLRDIQPVVRSLTDLPLTLVFSHHHYDHVGNGQSFPEVAVLDLPHLRARAPDGVLQFESKEHLGKVEGFGLPAIDVDLWLAPDALIDLGGRSVQVLYTPGHTTESLSLYDAQSGVLLSGDWFTEAVGPFLSNSSMEEFRRAALQVLCVVPADTRIYPAHKYVDGGGAPEPLGTRDLQDTLRTVERIQAKTLRPTEGLYPATYAVNARVTLYADLPWAQSWEVQYPELLPAACP